MSEFARSTWLGMSGTASVVVGLVWLEICSHVVQGNAPPGSIAYELRPPLGARIMVAAGVLMLIAAGGMSIARWLGTKYRNQLRYWEGTRFFGHVRPPQHKTSSSSKPLRSIDGVPEQLSCSTTRTGKHELTSKDIGVAGRRLFWAEGCYRQSHVTG